MKGASQIKLTNTEWEAYNWLPAEERMLCVLLTAFRGKL
jgi:hypothetical protein